MVAQEKPIDRLVHELKERAKELNCLYQVQELLSAPDITIDQICVKITEILPPGWQWPDVCQAKITYVDKSYQTAGFKATPWVQSAEIIVQEEILGRISVCYTEDRPMSDEGPFLKEERKLIDTIAEQFGFYVLHQQLRQVFQEQLKTGEELKERWRVILDLLKRTDPGLLMRLSRRMVNFLSWNNVQDVESLLARFVPTYREDSESIDPNRPYQGLTESNFLSLSDEIFTIAGEHISKDVILNNIQQWIKEDRSGFLVDVLVNPGSSLSDISSAIERYHLIESQAKDLTPTREKWFRVSMIRRILSDQPQFLEIARQHITTDDFSDFMHRVIYTTGSHGKLGGKGAGLFLAARILERSPREQALIHNIKTPKTWYLTSDAIFHFMSFNNLEDIVEEKYKEIGQVRQEYPYLVHLFKNSPLPPEIVKGLSLALDDFGDVPLIVRSSSLLEDQTGAAFAGKYKSLFIANKGTREERMVALMDAIVEVFASMYGPDPIEYRAEHGLLDYHEEMGIMIQEVVGTPVGDYYCPAFAGVAFSNNEFRWSSRIKREDGLIRLVPGLGTRAVDRLSDDYPILVSPGQPGLRVNVTLDEVIRYSPKKIDLINLRNRTFETVEIQSLLKEHGDQYPIIHQLVSLLDKDVIRQPSALGIDFEKSELITTFDNLVSRTEFIPQIQAILSVLHDAFRHPVDIEFAHDGTNLYLLQCRSQSYHEDSIPASIPKEVPQEKIVFTANRFISNGTVQDITHILYVDPEKYSKITDYQTLSSVGRAVSRLNQLLPKRKFILLGPGRWGSRGDIRLGVSVTYSDINNTAMLIEIARRTDEFIVDPSFGTHFFQDLVESGIRYLPLYPDDPGITFNYQFLSGCENILQYLLPDCEPLAEVVRVIDVPASTSGQVLQIFMNADTDKAVAILDEPMGKTDFEAVRFRGSPFRGGSDTHWQWRMQSAQGIAAQLDPTRFGVKAIYVIGSTKNATAGPMSDIDLLVHFQGTEDQRKDLLTWLEGWSLSLSQFNYLRTGYKTEGILDVHIVTDKDLEKRTGFASKIGAISDAAMPLRMGIR